MLVAEGRALRVIFGFGVLLILGACVFVMSTVGKDGSQAGGVDVLALERIAALDAQAQQARADEAIAHERVEEIRAQGDADVERITANTDAHARRVLLDAQVAAALEGVERRRSWRIFSQVVIVFLLVAACFFLFLVLMWLFSREEPETVEAKAHVDA